MKTTKLLICAVAAVAALASAEANGQNLTTTYTGVGIGSQVEGTWTNGTEVYTKNTGVMTFAGFDAFCVEPFQGLDPGQELTYQIQSPQSLANYQTIARLVTAYLQSNKTAENAAAIQWAIWETTSEELLAPSLVDGNIRIMGGAADQNIANLANGYLANLTSFALADLTYFKNDAYQDVVSWNVIPEPTSFGLAMLSGFLLLRRRRN